MSESAARRFRVLVVDDERMICEVVRRMLRSEYDVTTTTSAEEALEWIRGGARYDVILSDMMMPVMTGARFHETLVALDAGQADAVVFMTAAVVGSDADDYLRSVDNQVLRKPMGLDHLRGAVRGATQRR